MASSNGSINGGGSGNNGQARHHWPPNSAPANPRPRTAKARSRVLLTKFTLFETKARYYVLGCDEAESRFRVLKLDRTSLTSPSMPGGGGGGGGGGIPGVAPAYGDAGAIMAPGLAPANHPPPPAPSKASSLHGTPKSVSSPSPADRRSPKRTATSVTLADRRPISALGPMTSKTTMPLKGTPQARSTIAYARMPAPSPPRDEPPVVEDAAVYTRSECDDLLATIREGNRAIGGLHKVVDFYGIIGFVRFTEGYYMVLIKKRRAVATLGGHLVYHVEDTMMVNIRSSSKVERKNDEAR
ncbi:hypothetical protein THASP1DRAFT_28664 [Thamnocephalis sphaerospora]|uniref:SAC domain-containing protein n=1 Tax=Thamnocephalis sphaerospora TaxID=78915 RepID=A0A4P9XTP0_9FUNG|nr:hypothetical protein THASP1DRAFT_28664 [Thamnocephalis sphaerospora]|eukprot:RKP09533.1 hypothetical protein THASP1DRAFT_28664 [Thamnocephalis sphaerospora]